jgi:hypothetical protein
LFTINTIMIVFLEVQLNSRPPTGRIAKVCASEAVHRVRFRRHGLRAFGAGRGRDVSWWTIGEMILLPSMSNYVPTCRPRPAGEYMGPVLDELGMRLRDRAVAGQPS